MFSTACNFTKAYKLTPMLTFTIAYLLVVTWNPKWSDFMNDELRTKIDDLKMIIDVEEGNYKTALQSKLDFSTLRQMRENIKKLKTDLQVLVDQESVKRTGELPGDTNPWIDQAVSFFFRGVSQHSNK